MRIKLLLTIFSGLLLTTCKKEPRYNNFKITNVTVTAMPFLDGNSEWDPLDGPDVFFNIEDGAARELRSGSPDRFKDVAKSDLPLSWDFVDPYTVPKLEETQFITVYDYDTFDPNDKIGQIGFTMSEHKS